MNQKDSFNLEFKQEPSKTFLKTVSAFANYNDGRIVFGIDDDGNITGIDNAKTESLKIENMINDSISPIPDFDIQVSKNENKEIVILNVKKGKDTPYYYKGKAYRRSDTLTVEIDRFELRRLAMQGMNIDYESRIASSQ